jgi:hypothetical protein
VELFFKQDGPFRKGNLRQNPITGASFVHGVDPIEPQKRAARRALLAGEWFYQFGPHDAPYEFGPHVVPPLPLSSDEIEDMYRFSREHCHIGFYYLIAQFASSLRGNDWDFNIHPSFEDFACSVLASPYAQHLEFVEDDKGLRKRYPPCDLCRIGPELYWEPPKEKNRRIIARPK